MSKLDRYDVDYNSLYGFSSYKSEDGAWCCQDDVEELEQQNAKLLEALEEIAKCKSVSKDPIAPKSLLREIVNHAQITLAEVNSA